MIVLVESAYVESHLPPLKLQELVIEEENNLYNRCRRICYNCWLTMESWSCGMWCWKSCTELSKKGILSSSTCQDTSQHIQYNVLEIYQT